MVGWNIYDDGIGIVLSPARPATDTDLAAVNGLLDEWLTPYERDEGQRYRNCGVVGGVGATQITLWADRVDDPTGAGAAVATARRLGERAAEVLPLVSFSVGSATAASDADLYARTGARFIEVRPRRPNPTLDIALLALVVADRPRVVCQLVRVHRR
jgi:hypothetical protein